MIGLRFVSSDAVAVDFCASSCMVDLVRQEET